MGSGRGSSSVGHNELVRVLLVEDSHDHAELISTKLRRSKRIRVDIDHSDRLEKGLEKLEFNSYDVVLLDFSLPDSFGLDTFRRVHEAEPRTFPYRRHANGRIRGKAADGVIS